VTDSNLGNRTGTAADSYVWHQTHPPTRDHSELSPIRSTVVRLSCPPMPQSLWGYANPVKRYDRKELKPDKAFPGILN